MLWPGMRFSLRSLCKRCSAGRLQAESKCKRAFSNVTGDNHCNETGIVK